MEVGTIARTASAAELLMVFVQLWLAKPELAA